jgi:hypothetical protein
MPPISSRPKTPRPRPLTHGNSEGVAVQLRCLLHHQVSGAQLLLGNIGGEPGATHPGLGAFRQKRADKGQSDKVRLPHSLATEKKSSRRSEIGPQVERGAQSAGGAPDEAARTCTRASPLPHPRNALLATPAPGAWFCAAVGGTKGHMHSPTTPSARRCPIRAGVRW